MAILIQFLFIEFIEFTKTDGFVRGLTSYLWFDFNIVVL